MLSVLTRSRWLMLIAMSFFASHVYGHGMSEAEKLIIIEGGNLRYIWIGATHMLSGYDHLAFVFGIIFFMSSFKDIVKTITAFTLGHSITLIYATFNAITVNYFLVDAIIALSVVYIAFNNLDGFNKYFNVKAPNVMLMIFSLGLIHGLGLSTRLQELPLSEDSLLLNIISFNLGIEIGQISALAIMLVIIAIIRKSAVFSSFSKISNSLLIFAGGFLFLMQMHGYEHSVSSEEITISTITPSQNSLTDSLAPASDWQDSINIIVPARSDIEYKLLLEKGAQLDYHWQTAKGQLFYDFHGEPSGDSSGYFKSFAKNTDAQAQGMLITVFAGTHGWYWKNNNNFPVSITLQIKGQYQRLDLAVKAHKIEPIANDNPIHDSLF